MIEVIERAFSHTQEVRDLLMERMQVEDGVGAFHWRLTEKMAQRLADRGYADAVSAERWGCIRQVWMPTKKAVAAYQDIQAAHALLEKGIPLADRPRKLLVGKARGRLYVPYMGTEEHEEYLVGTFEGRPFYSNTHFAIEGTPPPGTEIKKVNIARVIPLSVPPQIAPRLFSYDGSTGQVHFGEGRAIDAKYWDLFQKHFPRATYHATGEWQRPILVRSDNRTVGIIMPVCPHKSVKEGK